MEAKEFIELYEEEGVKGIRGCMTLFIEGETPNPEGILGIAKEDIKKGHTVRATL